MHNFNMGIPSAEFTHKCSLPGIPTEAALSAIGMLLGSYGIKHQIPIDPTIDTSLLVSGQTGDRINDNNTATFFELMRIFDSYSREFTNTVAELQIYNGLYCFTFKCW